MVNRANHVMHHTIFIILTLKILVITTTESNNNDNNIMLKSRWIVGQKQSHLNGIKSK